MLNFGLQFRTQNSSFKIFLKISRHPQVVADLFDFELRDLPAPTHSFDSGPADHAHAVSADDLRSIEETDFIDNVFFQRAGGGDRAAFDHRADDLPLRQFLENRLERHRAATQGNP